MDLKEEFQQKRKDTGPIMFLSLFLLLLAFFILLNALSSFEETKSRKVIESVASTFQTQVEHRQFREILISTLGPVPEPEELLEEVERLWITAIPLTEVEVLSEGRIMQFELPVNDLFVGGRTDVRGDRADLVKASALALAARMEGFIPEMQFVIGVEDLQRVKTTRKIIKTVVEAEEEQLEEDVDPFDIFRLSDPTSSIVEPDNEDDRNLSFARAANFAQAVIDAGAPASGVSIGLVRGDVKQIRVRFYIHPEGEAFNRFQSVTE